MKEHCHWPHCLNSSFITFLFGLTSLVDLAFFFSIRIGGNHPNSTEFHTYPPCIFRKKKSFEPSNRGVIPIKELTTKE